MYCIRELNETIWHILTYWVLCKKCGKDDFEDEEEEEEYYHDEEKYETKSQ